jgi:hypothetical protein
MTAALCFSVAAFIAALAGPVTLGYLTLRIGRRHHRQVIGKLTQIHTLLIEAMEGHG